MKPLVPYINFKGNAKEALDMYAEAMSGQIAFVQTYAESGEEAKLEMKDKIMHAMLTAGDLTIMASDVEEKDVKEGNQVSLSMDFDNVEEMEKVFSALSDGANITMPLQDTFWGARFGMLTDKFGVSWMFNHDYEKK